MSVFSTILQAKSHLAVALVQVSPADDKIIIGHIRDAEQLLAKVLKELVD